MLLIGRMVIIAWLVTTVGIVALFGIGGVGILIDRLHGSGADKEKLSSEDDR